MLRPAHPCYVPKCFGLGLSDSLSSRLDLSIWSHSVYFGAKCLSLFFCYRVSQKAGQCLRPYITQCIALCLGLATGKGVIQPFKASSSRSPILAQESLRPLLAASFKHWVTLEHSWRSRHPRQTRCCKGQCIKQHTL